MTTMIERVARAIRDETATNRSISPDTRDLARAAIEAMRTPTDGMIEAGESGYQEFHKPTGTYLDPQPASVWSMMIDAALKESK